MSERPSELDLMLDAIDDAFKIEMTQFAKDAAVALQQAPKQQGAEVDKIADDIGLVRRARNLMIATVTAKPSEA